MRVDDPPAAGMHQGTHSIEVDGMCRPTSRARSTIDFRFSEDTLCAISAAYVLQTSKAA